MTKQQPLDLDVLTAQAVAIRTQIADLEDRLEAIKAVLRALPPGTHPFAHARVSIEPTYRFDADRAGKVIAEVDPNLWPLVGKTVVDRKLAQQYLSPDDYKKCQIEYPNPRVTIEEI